MSLPLSFVSISSRQAGYNLLNNTIGLALLKRREQTNKVEAKREKQKQHGGERDARRCYTHPIHKLHLLQEPINWQSANSVAVKMNEHS